MCICVRVYVARLNDDFSIFVALARPMTTGRHTLMCRFIGEKNVI